MKQRRGYLQLLAAAVTTVRRADRRGSAISTVLNLVSAANGLGIVLATKLALDAVTTADDLSFGSIAAPLALLALTVALAQSLAVLQQLRQRLLSERVRQSVWRELLDTTAAVDLATYQAPDFLDHLERVRNNALDRPIMVVSSLFGLVGATAGVLALGVALAVIEPLLIPALLAAGLPAVIVARRVSALEFLLNLHGNPIARRAYYLKQVLTERDNAAEVRAFGAAPHLLRRHGELDLELYDLMARHVSKRTRLALVGTAASALALAATFALIGLLLQRGQLSLASAGAAAISARLLSSQISAMFGHVSTLIECAPFLRDLDDFHSLGLEHTGLLQGRRRELEQDLRVESVTYTYRDQPAPVLHEVSIRIGHGQVVALVGENGSGKTTLAKIVSGLFVPDTGQVTWDGDGSTPPEDLRASTSVLLQDFIKYQMTARDNITIARAGEDDEAGVRNAAQRANVAGALERLSDGYDTMLGLELAAGSDLSGGQWQRLALARAFYRDSPLVILDEPSSALDPRAEYELFQDVRKVLDGRAALLISHRYSSVRLADYIYLMDDGRVLEQGTHDELMAMRSGRYAELYTLQAAAYR